MASSVISPGLPLIAQAFHITNETRLTFTLSIYMLGYAVGQLLFNPLTEVIGRLVVQHVCTLLFLLFNIGTALAQTEAQFLALRFFAGFFGSGLLSIGGSMVADMFVPEHRGAAMALFSAGVSMGPVVGPIVSGFVSEYLSFRWILWILVFASTLAFALALVFLRETYYPILALRHQKIQGSRWVRIVAVRFMPCALSIPPKVLLTKYLVRPILLLVKNPMCAGLSVELAMVFGYLYLLLASVAVSFIRDYHMKSSIAGLHYISLGVGIMTGIFITGYFCDKIYLQLRLKKGTIVKGPDGQEERQGSPEYRLPLLLPSIILVPVGLLVYGWPAENLVHWIVPDIGLAIFGLAFMSSFMVIQVYMLDAFEFPASALGAANLLRCIFGGVLPLAGPSLFDTLGHGWGCTTLAFIATAVGVPSTLLLMKYGVYLREHWARL
ncbi:Similar to S.cerevisiae protein TPO1 (Polyamine transporter of the major facilitator superfamily) [Malassezia sympodialis ATCC 42132]|uniref:Similar to S.cerevisiae protein TPO1 (Polyamine transporter of the major facilitator superfamily) n=1 Tax=Malassezia sympodialis (strain ATCC 42132) TaxID=1230383 RepID=A0A1M8AA95_MALS4|nr:Similar to S.cerevisiae protein TPO1 (Polyamine transporter of the major facilitator superfamily) [Malassezia sympodialis ATCC 42132]